MQRLFSLGLAGLFLITAVATPPRSARTYRDHYENVLGTSLDLKVSAFSEQASGRAEAAVLAEITRLSGILSAYDSQSEFSQWMKTSHVAVRVSPELFEVLRLFDEWRNRTDGALDASAEVIGKLWKKAAARGSAPTEEELAAAVSAVRQQHWKLDPQARTATHLSDVPLMLNSFVKSYIIRRAADAGLAAGGITFIVVNIGGDLVVAGKGRETVLVSDPRADAENDAPLDRLSVSGKAVATSGNYRRGELINGHWYSHIVDPRTGRPADGILSATVVAARATDAGALATAFNIMDTAESKRLAATVPGAEYLIITRAGRRIESAGWKAMELPEEKAALGMAAGDFELVIDLEIKMQQGFAKRPYVAVWVEDENHAPVRTISIWHGSDRYLSELKSWYLKYRDRYANDKNFNASITSATRSAGKYTIKWDGRDDQGNPVKPGRYTIKIEVSREHGTYQLMREDIAWDETTPKTYTLAGNAEIAAASLDYRKKTNGN